MPRLKAQVWHLELKGQGSQNKERTFCETPRLLSLGPWGFFVIFKNIVIIKVVPLLNKQIKFSKLKCKLVFRVFFFFPYFHFNYVFSSLCIIFIYSAPYRKHLGFFCALHLSSKRLLCFVVS